MASSSERDMEVETWTIKTLTSGKDRFVYIVEDGDAMGEPKTLASYTVPSDKNGYWQTEATVRHALRVLQAHLAPIVE